MTKEQRTYEHIRTLQEEIRKLDRKPNRSAEDFEGIEKREERLLSLCKDYIIVNESGEKEDTGRILLKGERWTPLLDRLESEETLVKKAPPRETLTSQSLDISQYAFYRIGEAWKMIWDYKEIVLKRGGFEYFHHCIEHNKKEFKNWELDYILNPGPKGSEALNDFKELKDGFSVGDLKAIFTRQQKLDYATVQIIQNHLTELEEDITKAEVNKDLGLVENLQNQKNEIEDCLAEAMKLKPFRDDVRRVSDRVNKAMDRALKELRRHSEDAYNHFHEAFSPIHSNLKRYRPTNPISWDLVKK